MAELPYHAIPDPPSSISAGSVLSRLVDGIGFRYRWASEGLEEGHLGFRPAPDCMSLGELLQHIHGLLRWVGERAGLDGRESYMRKAEGLACREASLRAARALSTRLAGLSDGDLKSITVPSSRGDALPVWNLINGPLADALTHVGQVASWRRIMGKPVIGVDVFRGLPPAPR